MDSSHKTKSYNDIWTFLALTFAASLACYLYIFRSGSLENSGYLMLGFMWIPGISAIITVLIHRRGMASLGWRPGKALYLLIGYFLPLLYALLSYGAVWFSGLGGYENNYMVSPKQMLIFATLGVLMSMISALGEEIGWRGYLVARLAQIMPFNKAALISGVIWLLWHTPLILFSNYNAPGVPVWYSWLCFSVMLMGITFAFSWLRLASGSLLPAALMHASHNMYIQGLFDVITVDTGITAYFTGEFGSGLALAGVCVGILFAWLGKTQLKRNGAEPLAV